MALEPVDFDGNPLGSSEVENASDFYVMAPSGARIRVLNTEPGSRWTVDRLGVTSDYLGSVERSGRDYLPLNPRVGLPADRGTPQSSLIAAIAPLVSGA